MSNTKRPVLAVAVAVAVLGMLRPASASADPPAQVVVGQSSAPVDVAAVQAAVSAGGRVVLVGTFDFGPAGRVLISKDVRISGRDGAVVKGGFVTFLSPLPAPPAGQPPGQRPALPGPDITIEHLTFDGATSSPIRIAYARSIEIRHNKIRNVVPIVNLTIPFPVSPYSVQFGIVVTTQGQFPPGIVPGAITGRVRIHHNELDMTSPDPALTVCSGVQLMRGWGVDADISHNTVSNCARNGIEALDNVRDESGAGRIRLSHNRVRSASVGSPWPVPSRPNGIVAGWFFFPARAIDPASNPAYEVSENDIEVGGGPASGIFANTNGAVIEENEIAVSGPGARGIVLSSANGLVKENRVAGGGQFGIQIAPFFPSVPTVVADGNTLLCNDLSGFDPNPPPPPSADLQLAGSHNTVIGAWGSVLDTGAGNQLVSSGRCEDEKH